MNPKRKFIERSSLSEAGARIEIFPSHLSTILLCSLDRHLGQGVGVTVQRVIDDCDLGGCCGRHGVLKCKAEKGAGKGEDPCFIEAETKRRGEVEAFLMRELIGGLR